jgi:hypothetical protein
MQKSKITDRKKGEYEIKEVRSRAPQIAANGSLNYNPILQTTVIDGAGFGQPGTIQAAFGQNGLSTAVYLLIKPCTTKLYL